MQVGNSLGLIGGCDVIGWGQTPNETCDILMIVSRVGKIASLKGCSVPVCDKWTLGRCQGGRVEVPRCYIVNGCRPIDNFTTVGDPGTFRPLGLAIFSFLRTAIK